MKTHSAHINRYPAISRRASQYASPASRNLFPVVFLVSLFLPILFTVGSLRLAPYRLMLVAAFVPLLVHWARGLAGGVRFIDICILGFCCWASLSFFYAYDLSQAIEPAGILVVETFGSYLVARCLIRDLISFRIAVRALIFLIVGFLPFAIYENLTGQPLLLQWIGHFFQVWRNVPMEPRLGLDRAQLVFEHPILFGVICSAAFSLSYYTLFRSATRRRLIALFVGVSVASSLSVGAFVSVAVQTGLIAWDKLVKATSRKWTILVLLIIFFYIIIDLISNRTPIEVFISYLTFNSGNSYNRVLIWHFGTQEVLRHPLFGIAFEEWARAYWMSTSMDNFWLVLAVRHGLPALAMMAVAYLAVFIQLGRLQGLDQGSSDSRKGLLIALSGIGVAACTVHLWNASFVLLMFLLGSGMWLLDAPASADADTRRESNSRHSVRRRGGALRSVRSTEEPTPQRTGSIKKREVTRHRPDKIARRRSRGLTEYSGRKR